MITAENGIGFLKKYPATLSKNLKRWKLEINNT